MAWNPGDWDHRAICATAHSVQHGAGSRLQRLGGSRIAGLEHDRAFLDEFLEGHPRDFQGGAAGGVASAGARAEARVRLVRQPADLVEPLVGVVDDVLHRDERKKEHSSAKAENVWTVSAPTWLGV